MRINDSEVNLYSIFFLDDQYSTSISNLMIMAQRANRLNLIKSCRRVCFPDMKPSHFIDRKEWAINDGQNPSQDLLVSSLAITTESRINETLSTDRASYKNSSRGREALE